MDIAKQAVLQKSNLELSLQEVNIQQQTVKGYDFNQTKDNSNQIDYDELLSSYLRVGFQATSFGRAVDEVNKMVFITLCSIFND